MSNIILYGHGGSGNHGCEAIVRSIHKIIGNINYTLMSSNAKEDILYGIADITTPISTITNNKLSWDFLIAYLKLKLCKKYIHIDLLPYRYYIKRSKIAYKVALSIGGDNYCYGDTSIYQNLNILYNKRNIKTAFIGCSIEPDTINQPEILKDLKRYYKIIARESITYNALVAAGLNNAMLLPDPAFQLDRVDLALPQGFIEGNTVGINLSPVVMNCDKGDNITIKNYEKLIEHIIDSSDMQIALIPHVVWAQNDDRIPLRFLYDKYKHTGRVVMIDDHNCMELKGYIARCRFMIAARTHASIAAYSTCVPTLVIGYSIKAKGIANDIFGTYENYVLPVQTISNENDILKAFDWIYQNEAQIRAHLKSTMPEYRERALQIGNALKELL